MRLRCEPESNQAVLQSTGGSWLCSGAVLCRHAAGSCLSHNRDINKSENRNHLELSCSGKKRVELAVKQGARRKGPYRLLCSLTKSTIKQVA